MEAARPCEEERGSLACVFGEANITKRRDHRDAKTSNPAWDGRAIAGTRLFLTTQTGELICLGDERKPGKAKTPRRARVRSRRPASGAYFVNSFNFGVIASAQI
jgi:hypothetical protein